MASCRNGQWDEVGKVVQSVARWASMEGTVTMKLVERMGVVPLATAQLLIENGARGMRTAAIAEQAGINESTLFRNYGNLEKIWSETDRWCWEQVYEQVSRASFESPGLDPKKLLLRDIYAIWEMGENVDLRVAATCAFLFKTRKQSFQTTGESKAQAHFEARVLHLCEEIADGYGVSRERGKTVAKVLLNYLASVWLTWSTMLIDSDDITSVHDLTSDEAQLGVSVLLSEEYFRCDTRSISEAAT